jgi:ferritin-like metal-binding protein YciE
MKMKSLEDLFLHELRDLYSAEKQLLKALPKMAKAASHDSLKAAFEDHLSETEGQVERLEEIFELIGKPARAETCKAMQGLVEEGSKVMEEAEEDNVRDAALIGAAQKVEHYEIASYGTLRTFAELLGHHEAAELLDTTLEEEAATDKKLTELAESVVNADAAHAESE